MAKRISKQDLELENDRIKQELEQCKTSNFEFSKKVQEFKDRNKILEKKLQEKVDPNQQLKVKYDQLYDKLNDLQIEFYKQEEELQRSVIHEEFQLWLTDMYRRRIRTSQKRPDAMSLLQNQNLSQEEEISRYRIAEEFQLGIMDLSSEASKIKQERTRVVQLVSNEEMTRSRISETMYQELIELQIQNIRPYIKSVKSDSEVVSTKEDITEEFEMWRPILKIENSFMWTETDISVARALRDVIVASPGTVDNYTEMIRRLRIKTLLTSSPIYAFLRSYLRKPSTSRGIVQDIQLLPA